MHAQCLCGQLSAELPGPIDQVVACHCTACQRRSGSPFGTIAYYPQGDVAITGEATQFTRIADSGMAYTTAFCPRCGSTVWCLAEGKPGAVGIPLGAIADPGYPAPARSVWEQTRHHWVAMPEDIPHFQFARS